MRLQAKEPVLHVVHIAVEMAPIAKAGPQGLVYVSSVAILGGGPPGAATRAAHKGGPLDLALLAWGPGGHGPGGLGSRAAYGWRAIPPPLEMAPIAKAGPQGGMGSRAAHGWRGSASLCCLCWRAWARGPAVADTRPRPGRPGRPAWSPAARPRRAARRAACRAGRGGWAAWATWWRRAVLSGPCVGTEEPDQSPPPLCRSPCVGAPVWEPLCMSPCVRAPVFGAPVYLGTLCRDLGTRPELGQHVWRERYTREGERRGVPQVFREWVAMYGFCVGALCRSQARPELGQHV
jgi:hypothetical protein